MSLLSHHRRPSSLTAGGDNVDAGPRCYPLLSSAYLFSRWLVWSVRFSPVALTSHSFFGVQHSSPPSLLLCCAHPPLCRPRHRHRIFTVSRQSRWGVPHPKYFSLFFLLLPVSSSDSHMLHPYSPSPYRRATACFALF